MEIQNDNAIGKTEPTEEILSIKIGERDPAGNIITDVLARGNEYAIYEIETNDLNKKLRCYIDGLTDESEKKLAESYIKVKEKFVIAKGLLYRSENLGIMKNRVANILATALCGHPEESLERFDNLITEINLEYRTAYQRRLWYILPGYLLLTLFIIFLTFDVFINFSLNYPSIFEWLSIVTASIIGGVFSLTLNLKNIRFGSAIGRLVFSLYGLERISISILAGIICAVGIKSKFILGNLSQDDNSYKWSLLFFVIAAAFSEKMVPNIISRFSEKEYTES